MIFQTIDELDLFLEDLKIRKTTTTGNWTLAQILCHIGDSIEFFLSQNEGAIQIPSFIQNTVGKLLLNKFFLFGKMDKGLQNPIKKGEPKDGDPLVELERVIDLSKKFKDHTGKFNQHPVFGALSKEELIKLHLLHCSNHFSYIQIAGD
jgi:hypothetical protein